MHAHESPRPLALVVAGPYLGAKVWTIGSTISLRGRVNGLVADGDMRGKWVALSPEHVRVIKRKEPAPR